MPTVRPSLSLSRVLKMGSGDFAALMAAIVVFLAAILPFTAGEAVPNSFSSFEWQPLSRSNFSSEIRAHPHVLLLVTVPWSGESRTLMAEIRQIATQKHEKFSQLKLMFVYRNTEKTLADLLGAAKGISFICYHHSVAFKYQGRLRAWSLLMSAYHLMLLPPAEPPFRQLNTVNELQAFLQSTDKAVLLFEFCGWTQMLLAKQQAGLSDERGTGLRNLSSFPLMSSEDTDGDQHITNVFTGREEQKGSNNAPLTCGVANGQNGNDWLDEFTFTSMNNSSVGAGTGGNGPNISCRRAEFQRYESFFSKLVTVARENFLPPDKLRYGIISRKDLLWNLGIKDEATWLLLLHFIGCPNCSKMLKDGDDLSSILLMRHPLMIELEDKGHSLEPALPLNRPSIVLFVDRSSELSKVRKRSEAALKILRKFALESQPGFQMADGINKASKRLLEQIIPQKKRIFPASSKLVVDVSQAPVSVDSVLRKDGNVRLDKVDAHGQTAYEFLLGLLGQNNPSLVGEQVGMKVLPDYRRIQNQIQESQRVEVLVRPIDKQSIHQQNPELSNNIGTEEVGKQVEAAGVNDAAYIDSTTSNNEDTRLNLFGSILEILEDQIMDADEKTILETFKKNVRLAGFSSSFIDCNDQISNVRYATLRQPDICPIKTIKGFICGHPTVNPEDYLVVAKSFDGVDSLEKLQRHDFKFDASFFFSDGGYLSLKSMTGETKVPSLIIVDPIKRQHYLFPRDSSFSYSTLIDFINSFLNGSLVPYERSETPLSTPLEVPYPTLVNQKSHQACSIPFISAREFTDKVLGDHDCEIEVAESCAGTQLDFCLCKKDVLVLFSNSWCGFCRRMELVVREVHHAFKGYVSMLQNRNKLETGTLIGVPSFLRMDCTLNECGSILKPVHQGELYPSLMLFPAGKKSGIYYEGEISVSDLIEFIFSYGSNTHLISGMEGILWKRTSKLVKTKNSSWYSSSEPSEAYVHSNKRQRLEVLLKRDQPVENQQNLADLPTSGEAYDGKHVHIGSVLTASDKINIVPPFDKSKIVIVKVDQDKSFLGLMINKQLKWDVLLDLGHDVELLRAAPLFYGGPVVVPNAPLVSLTRNPPNEGYSEILPGLFFGDQSATGGVVKMIKSGSQSASDFWFFLGFASWGWEQLYNEIAHGAWHLIDNPDVQLQWPET
ncbi:uncharacterized protein LOC116261080 [Nymphaea colorata]|nr:uncharacterized protein LOC116261080 [Nymphaea colorata]